MLRLDQTHITQGAFSLRADFTVEPGLKVAVVGPSGAGKSTLLGAIGGFVPLVDGRIVWRDTDITDAAPGARPVAMLFQDNNLFPHLNIEQNVSLGLRPDMRLSPDDKSRVADALRRVGLSKLGASKPSQLSGGQQSRAALARILVQDRPLLLLDEPFAALGPALRSEMLDLVAALVDETRATLLMVTHAPEDARHFADAMVFVDEGVAQAPVPMADAMENPPPALKAYLG